MSPSDPSRTVTDINSRRPTGKAWMSTDLVRATGITFRQLDYWVRTGLVPQSSHPTTGSGDPRWFSFDDALTCAVVAKLVKGGLALSTIRERLHELHELLDTDSVQRLQLAPGLWLELDLPAERTRLEHYKREAV